MDVWTERKEQGNENKREAKKNKHKYQTFSHIFLLLLDCSLVFLSLCGWYFYLSDINGYIRFQCLATWVILGVSLFQSQLSIFVASSCWGQDQLTHLCTSFGYFQDNPSTSFIISMPALGKFRYHFWAFFKFRFCFLLMGLFLGFSGFWMLLLCFY